MANWDIDAEDLVNFVEHDEVLYLEAMTVQTFGRSWMSWRDVAQAAINKYRDTAPPDHKVTCDVEDLARALFAFYSE